VKKKKTLYNLVSKSQIKSKKYQCNEDRYIIDIPQKSEETFNNAIQQYEILFNDIYDSFQREKKMILFD